MQDKYKFDEFKSWNEEPPFNTVLAQHKKEVYLAWEKC